MPIPELFTYQVGSQGRGIVTDSDGRLVATADVGASGFVYSFGSTGRPLVVDASGRMILSPLSTGFSDNTSAANIGAGSGIFAGEVGDELQFKSLVPGSNISFVVDGDEIIINGSVASGTGTVNNGVNDGAGAEVFKVKSGTDLHFRTLIGGSGITIEQGTDEITINNADHNDLALLQSDFASLSTDFANSSGVFVKTASNQGGGTEVFKQKTAQDLEFRTLVAGSGIKLVSDTNTVTINNQVDTLDELEDVTITSPASGQHLRYNGTQWVNGTIEPQDLPNHTHVSTDITDFVEATQDVVGAFVVDTPSVSWVYSDGGNTLKANVSSGTFYLKHDPIIASIAGLNIGSEAVRFGTLFVASGNFSTGFHINNKIHFDDADIVPQTTNVYNLGKSSRVFANIYGTNIVATSGSFSAGLQISDKLHIDSADAVPQTTNTYNLGKPTKVFANVYSTNLVIASGSFSTGLQINNKLHIDDADIVPQITNSYNLGKATRVFANIFATNVVAVSGAFSTGLQVASAIDFDSADVVPRVPSVYNIGNLAKPFGTIFSASGRITNGIQVGPIVTNAARLTPIVTSVTDLGSASKIFNTIFAASGRFSTGLQAGPLVLNAARLAPIITSTTDLGSASKAFNNAFAASGRFTSGEQIGPIVINAARVSPIVDNVTDLGKLTKRFNTMFAASGSFSNGIQAGPITINAARLAPIVVGSTNLGSATKTFNAAFIGTVAIDSTDILTPFGTPGLAIAKNNDTQTCLQLIGYNIDAGARIHAFRTRATTTDANTIVATGDEIFSITGFAADGASYRNAAKMSFEVDGSPGSSDMPGRIVFSTAADGGITLTERMRIQNDGAVGIGVTPIAGTKLCLNGIEYNGGQTSLSADLTTVVGSTPPSVIDRSAASALVGIKTGALGTAGFTIYGMRTKDSTNAADTVVTTGQELLAIRAYGADGAAYQPAAAMLMEVDGGAGTGDMPGRIVFSTTADAASSLTEAIRINNAQNVGIGQTVPAGRLEVKYTQGSYFLALRSSTEATSDTVRLAFMANGTGTDAASDTNIIAAIFAEVTQATPSALKGRLIFRTNGGDNTSPAGSIEADGTWFIGSGSNTEGDDVGVGAAFGANAAATSAAGNFSIQSTDNFAVNLGGSLCLGGRTTTSSTVAANFAKISGRKENTTSADKDGFLEFATQANSGGMTAKAVILSTGNMGIGILASLSGRLHVKGASAATALHVEQVGSPTNCINTNAGAGTPARLTSGGTWTNASCYKIYKTNFEDVDKLDFLKKINEMEIQKFNHKVDVDGAKENIELIPRKYLSCFQDDLVEKFGLGDDGISPQEVASLALVGIQGLSKKINDLYVPNTTEMTIIDKFDTTKLFDNISALNINTLTLNEIPTINHIGCASEEFFQTFALGAQDEVSSQDVAFIALAGVKALISEVNLLKEKVNNG